MLKHGFLNDCFFSLRFCFLIAGQEEEKKPLALKRKVYKNFYRNARRRAKYEEGLTQTEENIEVGDCTNPEAEVAHTAESAPIREEESISLIRQHASTSDQSAQEVDQSSVPTVIRYPPESFNRSQEEIQEVLRHQSSRVVEVEALIQDEQQPIVGTEELHHGILVNDEDDGKTIYSGYVPLVL